MKPVKLKQSSKEEREYQVLIGLIDEYIKNGKPIGSNTLKETAFESLSSATIRNYFASLEKQGYLEQLYSSGGRVPTEKAFRLYCKEMYDSTEISADEETSLESLRSEQSKEIASYLQRSAETLSSLTEFGVFLSAPRFDHDFIVDIKLVSIDIHRFLCVLITDFGVIQTEVIHTDFKLSSFSVKRMEAFFHWRLTNTDKPTNLTEEEERLAQNSYNEIMVRYIVGYSNFIDEEIYRTGFSRLLSYPEFHDPVVLANSLSLFENAQSMRLLLRECAKQNRLKTWIGSDLTPYSKTDPSCTVIAIPYRINQQTIGAIGVLGPIRMPYKQVFGMVRAFADNISEALTRNIYKFKINYRKPEPGASYLQGNSGLILLEDQTKRTEE